MPGGGRVLRAVFGGESNVVTFGDMPGVPPGPDEADKVMHAMLTGENGIVLMAGDRPKAWIYQPFDGSISLSGDDEPTLRRYWKNSSTAG